MKRKNLFLFSVLVLFSYLTFFYVSCFSGFQEKGDVTIAFSESTLRQIMARGGEISEEQEGDYQGFKLPSFPFSSDLLQARYYGVVKDYADNFSLFIFKDYTYAVYSANLMEKMGSNLNYQNLVTNPFSILDSAIVSKGTWSQSGDSISITETHYLDAESGELVEVSSPSVTEISANDSSFTVPSAFGYSITFYPIPNDNDNDIDIPVHEKTILMVGLEVGGKNYVKIINFDEQLSKTKKLIITYSDMPLGQTAKATAMLYIEFYGEKEILAKGESDKFVIQAGLNSAKIIMREYNGEDEPFEEEDIEYNAISYISDEYEDAKKIFNGSLYFNAYSDNTYEIIGDVYDQNGDQESKLFAKGTWEFVASEDSAGYLSLIETDYFDFDEEKLISGADGELQIDLSKKKFNYNGWSAVELKFKFDGYEPDYTRVEVTFDAIPVEDVDGTWALEKVTTEENEVFLAPEGWNSYIWYLDGSQVSSSEDKENEYILNGVSGGTHTINCLMKRTVDGKEATLYLNGSFSIVTKSISIG